MSDSERESLAATFERHAEEEGKILAVYRTLAERLGDSTVGFLVDQILTEEEMHHLLLHTIAKWLRTHPAGEKAAIPPGADQAELLRLTQNLRRHEEETITACRNLKSQLSKEQDDLLRTLLDIMVLDSEKHHQLLVAAEKLMKA